MKRQKTIQTGENVTHHELQEKLKIIQTLQNDWRKTGSAGKKADEEIWKRFKTAGDIFFRQKQEFYQHKKKEYAANLQAKNGVVYAGRGTNEQYRLETFFS